MPQLIDKAFNRLVEAVEENVAWQGGTGSEWECDGIVGHNFLADLVRLAFEAPQSDRDEFIGKYVE